MKRKILIAVGVIYAVFIVEFIVYMIVDSDNQEASRKQKTHITRQNQPTSTRALPTHASIGGSSKVKTEENLRSPGSYNRPNQESMKSRQASSFSDEGMGSDHVGRQETAYADIEEIKQKIYDMNIEYIEDLESLEQIVQTGDADQADFWEGDWFSADDWKRRHDAFQLTINKNGSFSFATEDRIHKTSQAFSFDNEKREFYWEEDYYGKTITHRAKFITPSTLLIIKTSGIKVNLDIYETSEE